jgi:hypothetical protein
VYLASDITFPNAIRQHRPSEIFMKLLIVFGG